LVLIETGPFWDGQSFCFPSLAAFIAGPCWSTIFKRVFQKAQQGCKVAFTWSSVNLEILMLKITL
jgi:hypothetical protein